MKTIERGLSLKEMGIEVEAAEDSGTQEESRTFTPEEWQGVDVEERTRVLFGDYDIEQMERALGEQGAFMMLRPSDEAALPGEPTVILAPGWTESNETVVGEGQNLLERGYGVAIPRNPRQGEVHQAPEELGLEEMGVSLTGSGFQRSLNLLNGMGRNEVEKAAVVAHSEGAIDAMVAALIDPARFEDGIVLVNPTLMENDNLAALLVRFVPQLMKNKLSQNISGTAEIARNPVRAVSEGMSVANTDLMKLVEIVQLLGVPVSLILNEKDSLFPAERILSRIEKVRHEGETEDESVEHKSVEHKSVEHRGPFVAVSVAKGHHNTIHEAEPEMMELLVQHLEALKSQG